MGFLNSASASAAQPFLDLGVGALQLLDKVLNLLVLGVQFCLTILNARQTGLYESF